MINPVRCFLNDINFAIRVFKSSGYEQSLKKAVKNSPNTNFDIFPQKQYMKAYFPNFTDLLYVWGVSHGCLKSWDRFFGTLCRFLDLTKKFKKMFENLTFHYGGHLGF